ncbi:nectin-2 isoform X1 [Astyanax mexicanus]|uniref:Si:ch73-22o12.1 n=1 Tax=Astyanax mexicanus TaxID=7994 RepID=W5LF49_ASTMX|nr:nectin-2 isoform X1 [Astyanax mexicanus]
MVWDSSLSSVGLLSSFFFLLIQGSLAQRVKVQPEVVTYPGQTVTLRCQFPEQGQTELTQVSWIFEKADGTRTNIAVFHPKFGVNYPKSPVTGRVGFTAETPQLDSPTIQITDIKMTDEGRYICEYATYPSGNEQGVTSLIILAKPENSATAVKVQAGTASVVVASCQSANGRPASTISWVPGSLNGNASTPTKTDNPDNTVTSKSEYWLVPTPADNDKEISCVVSHRTLPNPETFQMKLVIEYPPQVQIVGYDNNWYLGRTNAVLTCQAQGNPTPTTVTWRTMSGLMPDTVQVKENKLTVVKVDETVNATFICEVRNSLGTGRDQVSVMVREAGALAQSSAGVVAGAIIGVLLALLLFGALIFVLVSRNRRQQQGYRGNGKAKAEPYDSVARLFGSGGGSGKNGTNGNNGNNNTPIYRGEPVLSEKAANHNMHPGGVALLETTPTAQDILLSREMDEAERRKFDELEEEDERYDHFTAGGTILQLRPHEQDMGGSYLDDDMESQRDGSVISRTAVYV